MRVDGTAPPAGGAAADEIVIAATIAATVLSIVFWFVVRERLGHRTLVRRISELLGKPMGLPAWTALPVALGVGSVLLAGFGVWWDVPTHMQSGRDAGPLANPSHYPIFFGLLGIAAAGLLSMGLARDPLPRRTLRITRNWRVPFGPLIITCAGTIALLGFPADDLWHRMFGQDVTEWGPTHVMMIGGAVTFVLGFPLLLAEAAQVAHRSGLIRRIIGRVLAGVAIAVCSIPFAFLMEFDLGVPQFPAATQFLIFAFVMTWICVAARLWVGPGGAIIVGAIYLGAHVFLWAAIWLLPDVLTARFLLGIPAVIIIEFLALLLRPKRTGRPVRFAVTCGLLVGSLGMYAEWWWSKAFMPLPQPFNASSLPFLLGVSSVAGVGGGLMAVWLTARTKFVGASEPPPNGRLPHRWLGLAALVVFIGLMAGFGVPSEPTTYRGTITYSDVSRPLAECWADKQCMARVTVTIHGSDPVPDAVWFYALAWQGHPKHSVVRGPLDPTSSVPGIIRTKMHPTGKPGQYQSADRLPIYGSWKTLLRLHTIPTAMVSFPVYAPDDPAVESARGRQVRVKNGSTISTELERNFLQREQKDDVPMWLWTVAYGVIMGMWIAALLFYGWCYNQAAAPASGKRKDVERDERL